jgi:hypothetical protein
MHVRIRAAGEFIRRRLPIASGARIVALTGQRRARQVNDLHRRFEGLISAELRQNAQILYTNSGI